MPIRMTRFPGKRDDKKEDKEGPSPNTGNVAHNVMDSFGFTLESPPRTIFDRSEQESFSEVISKQSISPGP